VARAKVAVQRPVEAPQPVAAVPVHHHPKHLRLRPAPEPKTEEPAEPLLVKLETPDPDVVIYWIVEGKGD
jgi:hypothetical protein